MTRLLCALFFLLFSVLARADRYIDEDVYSSGLPFGLLAFLLIIAVGYCLVIEQKRQSESAAASHEKNKLRQEIFELQQIICSLKGRKEDEYQVTPVIVDELKAHEEVMKRLKKEIGGTIA